MTNQLVTPAQLKTLRDFNDKVFELMNESFFKGMHAPKSGVSVKWKRGQELKIHRTGPNIESIKAAILNIRFFGQNKDSISLQNMAEIYGNKGMDSDLSDEFNRIRKDLNDFLDKNSILKGNETTFTRRMVFDAIVYGKYAHAQLKYKAVLDNWQGPPMEIFMNEFCYTMAIFIRAVAIIRGVNLELLKRQT